MQNHPRLPWIPLGAPHLGEEWAAYSHGPLRLQLAKGRGKGGWPRVQTRRGCVVCTEFYNKTDFVLLPCTSNSIIMLMMGVPPRGTAFSHPTRINCAYWELTHSTHSVFRDFPSFPQRPHPSSHLTPVRWGLQRGWTSLLQGECLRPLSLSPLSDNNLTATY